MIEKKLRYALVFALAVSVAASVTYLIRYVTRPKPTPWLMTYVPTPHTTGSPYSKWFHEVSSRLWIDIGQKKELTDAEVDELIGYLDVPFTANWATDSDAMSEVEGANIFSTAQVVVHARVQYDKHLTDAQRQRMMDALAKGLDHPSAFARSGAIQCVCSVPIIADPKVRKKVLALQRDPDVKVASNAKRQLDAYLDAAREGKAPPPRDD